MKIRDKWLPNLIALSLLLIYLSPYIFFLQHAHFLIHDNLDSCISWSKMLADSGLTFSSTNTNFPYLFNGIPRGCLPPEFDMYTMLNLICSPLFAYCLLIIVQHLVAYFGMYLLLFDYFFKKEFPWQAAFLALAFALLPFWPFQELSVAGQPLVIWALLNLFYSKKTIYNWVIIILFPFCIYDFVFSNLFFLPVVLAGILVLFYISKKWNSSVILAWCLLLALSVLSSYHLFILQFVNHLVPARGNNIHDALLGLKGYAYVCWSLFLNGQYHFYSCQFPVIIITFILSLFIVRSLQYYKTVIIPVITAIILCSLDTFHYWSASEYFFKKLGNLSSLQIRFETMLPLIWSIIFAISIYHMVKQNKKLYILSLLLASIQIVFLFFNINSCDYQGSSLPENAFYFTYIEPNDYGHTSFKAYFAPDIFTAVKKRINYKEETTLCIGFPSEMAQFNNFHTAASYLTYYPKEKKQELIDIFAPGLNKIKDSIKLNEITGTRRFQYYISDEEISKPAIKLDLDTLAMKKMDIKYVLSRKAIENHTKFHLQNIDSLFMKNSDYLNRLFIYKFD